MYKFQITESADIDIVADNKPEKKILLCECKWRQEHTGPAEIRKLISKASLIQGYDEYYFMFFSKSPFTDDARSIEQANKNIKLVTLSMLFE